MIRIASLATIVVLTLLCPGDAAAQPEGIVRYEEPAPPERDLALVRVLVVDEERGEVAHAQEFFVDEPDLDGVTGNGAGGIERRQQLAFGFPDGSYTVRAIAVDVDGQASLPSNELRLVVETPPSSLVVESVAVVLGDGSLAPLGEARLEPGALLLCALISGGEPGSIFYRLAGDGLHPNASELSRCGDGGFALPAEIDEAGTFALEVVPFEGPRDDPGLVGRRLSADVAVVEPAQPPASPELIDVVLRFRRADGSVVEVRGELKVQEVQE